MRGLFLHALLLACVSGVHAQGVPEARAQGVLRARPQGVLEARPQGVLDRRISLRVHRLPLAAALDTIAARGSFAFSYNSTILPGDSLVSFSGSGSVRQVLDALLGARYQYVPRDGYVIIVRAPAPPAVYTVTGTVIDQATGMPVANASVYEPEKLQSTLTDEHGFFRLRLREHGPFLAVSKEWYEDTIFTPESGHDCRVLLRPVPVTEITPVVITSSIERSWWGRLFLTSRQRVQSLNLVHFFTDKPYQVSLVPSIGTQGRMGSQVTNTVSLNLIGGYSAGTHGVEIAGVFNLDRKSVRHVQAAGAFNIAGGTVVGLQAAGCANVDMDSARGAILAGGANVVYGSASGALIAGGANLVHGTVQGAVLAGGANIVHGSVSGVLAAAGANVVHGQVFGAQIAGAFNDCRGTVYGLQASALYNHAVHLKGVQIGLINIADTSSGYSIGLVSFVRHGLHQVSVSYDDGWTLAYRSGNPKLYSILLAGYNPDGPTIGYGAGRAFPLAGRWGITTEVAVRQVYDRHWNEEGTVYRLSPSLTFRLSHTVSVFAGPYGSLYVPSGRHSRDVPPFGAAAGLLFF
ncbi:hypothetical protein EDB95_5266 [Dinghuibacter silviterrae]|uniref:Carboxypeptidase-like protein n=2 Tax=Dinghuibacter silviterrae TaxID=1539049 RepID=A0A4R8DIM8_9BACT|nr:hypothetical protein EDB95_5266 [Dinghuibacter silviterrae]